MRVVSAPLGSSGALAVAAAALVSSATAQSRDRFRERTDHALRIGHAKVDRPATSGIDGAEKVVLPDWAVPLLAGGVLILMICQVCAIGYVYACHRARYEGRSFWFKGNPTPIVETINCCDNSEGVMTETMIGELQHDLRVGRAYWTGIWTKDYRFRVANFHPLFSIFLCHPLHPYGKIGRTLVFAITLAFMVAWRLVIEPLIDERQLLPVDWDRDIAPGFYALRKLLNIHMYGQMVLFLYVTTPAMVAQFLFSKLAVLHDSISDFHREYRENTCCTLCATSFLTCIGWVACVSFYILAALALGTILYMTVQLLRVEGSSDEFFYYIAVIPQSLVHIWLIWWFVFDLLCPYFGFGLCHLLKGNPCLEALCWQWWVEEETSEKEPAWRVADTAHAKFGLEVSDDALENERTTILRENFGLVLENNNKWVAVERVKQADLENWVASKITGAEKGHELIQEVQTQRAEMARLRDRECAPLVHCCPEKSQTRGQSGIRRLLTTCGARCGATRWLGVQDGDAASGSFVGKYSPTGGSYSYPVVPGYVGTAPAGGLLSQA